MLLDLRAGNRLYENVRVIHEYFRALFVFNPRLLVEEKARVLIAREEQSWQR